MYLNHSVRVNKLHFEDFRVIRYKSRTPKNNKIQQLAYTSHKKCQMRNIINLRNIINGYFLIAQWKHVRITLKQKAVVFKLVPLSHLTQLIDRK